MQTCYVSSVLSSNYFRMLMKMNEINSEEFQDRGRCFKILMTRDGVVRSARSSLLSQRQSCFRSNFCDLQSSPHNDKNFPTLFQVSQWIFNKKFCNLFRGWLNHFDTTSSWWDDVRKLFPLFSVLLAAATTVISFYDNFRLLHCLSSPQRSSDVCNVAINSLLIMIIWFDINHRP